MSSSHQSLSLSLCPSVLVPFSPSVSPPPSLHIKQTSSKQCTHTSSTHTSIQQLSHWHTEQLISGSVEDGCHGSTSWAMLPHDQRCDAAEPVSFLCSALLPACCCCCTETQAGTLHIPQMSMQSPKTICYIVKHETVVRANSSHFVFFHSV